MAFGHGIGPHGIAQLLGGCGGLRPHLGDGNRRNKGSDEASSGGTGERVVDAVPAEGATELLDELTGRLVP